MYIPQQIGIPSKAREQVVYVETAPPDELKELFYCTWELQTTAPLDSSFMYLVLPDVCTDVIFDLHTAEAEKAFVMSSGNSAEEINLGKSFHFVGIRFFPGVLTSRYIQELSGSKDVQTVWQQLRVAPSHTDRNVILLHYADKLLKQGHAAKNYLMHQVLSHAQELRTVQDIETLTGYTRRQLQRIFRQQTGLAPRDFLKILRFQQALDNGTSDIYTDQSHLIREFKRITGSTPTSFKAKY